MYKVLNTVVLIETSSFFKDLGLVFICLAIIPNSYVTHQHTVADI